MTSIRELLALPEGPVDLSSIDTRATPGAPGDDKDQAAADLEAVVEEIADLQERLWAEHVVDDSPRKLLLVLQGMDTSGKGGVVKAAFSGTNPRWLAITGFGAPTAEEREHHFLWRIRRALPAAGEIGVFDRSHYEDVLVPRVRELEPEEVWRARYSEINAFEQVLADEGCTVIKVFLHVSRDYQRERQLRRLEREDKRWKFDEGDLEDRERWDGFRAAYEELMERCPGWLVVPADRKWYRQWAVATVVLEALRELDLQWPARPDLDVDALTKRLNAS